MKDEQPNQRRLKLFQEHKNICTSALELMVKKNHDYAYGDDPFANFKRGEMFGICSTEAGIILRVLDKISRLGTFITAGSLKTNNESYEDAVIDVINYMVLLSAYIKEKEENV